MSGIELVGPIIMLLGATMVTVGLLSWHNNVVTEREITNVEDKFRLKKEDGVDNFSIVRVWEDGTETEVDLGEVVELLNKMSGLGK